MEVVDSEGKYVIKSDAYLVVKEKDNSITNPVTAVVESKEVEEKKKKFNMSAHQNTANKRNRSDTFKGQLSPRGDGGPGVLPPNQAKSPLSFRIPTPVNSSNYAL